MRLLAVFVTVGVLNLPPVDATSLSGRQARRQEQAASNHAIGVSHHKEGVSKSGILHTTWHQDELKIPHGGFKAFMYHKGPIPFFEDSVLGDIRKSWSHPWHELGIQSRHKGEFHQMEEEIKLAFAHIEKISWSRAGLDKVTTVPSPIRVRGVLIQRLIVALSIVKRWNATNVDVYRLFNHIVLNVAVMSNNQAELRGMFEWCYAFSDKQEIAGRFDFFFGKKTVVTPVPGFGQAMMVLYEIARFIGIAPVDINQYFNGLHERVKEGQMNSEVAKRFMELYNKCSITDLMNYQHDIVDWLAQGCPNNSSHVISGIMQRTPPPPAYNRSN